MGFQAVRAVLQEAPGRARQLFVQRGRRDARVNEVIALAKAAGVRFQSKDAAWFKQRVADGAHQGGRLVPSVHMVERFDVAERR